MITGPVVMELVAFVGAERASSSIGLTFKLMSLKYGRKLVGKEL